MVINDFATAADLLGTWFLYLELSWSEFCVHVLFTDRRSNIYSDRSRFIMASEILSGNMNLALISYGDRSVTPDFAWQFETDSITC